MCTYCITPITKGLCDIPLVLLTLKFHNLHPFLIYTPIRSVYAHPIFNCVVVISIESAVPVYGVELPHPIQV